MPVERAFFPQIDVTDQQDGDVDEHLYVAVDSKSVRYLEHIAINVGPRVQKDRLDVEQDEDHRDEIKLHRKWFARVAHGFDTALICGLFCAIWTSPPDQDGKTGQNTGKAHRDDEV